MDLLSGEELYEKLFTFKETSPLTAKFEELDYGNMNYVQNSGSILILLVLILLEPFALILLNKICVMCSKHYIFRVIGAFFYNKKPFSGLRNALIRLFMESYLELCMCTFLNVMAFSHAKNLSELIEFFSTIDDLLCSMLTCLTFILILIFPFWAAKSIKNNFGSLGSKKTQQLYGPLYEDIKTNSLYRALY